jgi:phosphate/sulfate permease
MRFIVDIVENVTSSIRFIVGLIVVAGLLIGLFFTAGVATVAPEVVERVGEKAIAAEKAQRVAHEMGKDGWGYSAAAASAGEQDAGTKVPSEGDDGWAE